MDYRALAATAHVQTKNHSIQYLEPDAGTNVVLQMLEFKDITFRNDLSGIVKKTPSIAGAASQRYSADR